MFWSINFSDEETFPNTAAAKPRSASTAAVRGAGNTKTRPTVAAPAVMSDEERAFKILKLGTIVHFKSIFFDFPMYHLVTSIP